MARRNIFDRDTRAGDYSDTLGSFIESIPSIYGQLAKEKRLERLDREDRNFRTTQYNNQLLQQARNNKRQDNLDILNQNQFQFKKEKENFDRDFEVAKLAYEAGYPNRLTQLNQKYNLGMDASQTDNLISNVTNRKEFEKDLLDFNSLSPTEKFEKGADLKDLISRGRQLSNFGNSQDKYLTRNTVINLQKELNELVKNSGQLITDTNMWEGLEGRTAATAYNKNLNRIKNLEEQINKLEISNNELTFGVNPSIDKQSTKKKSSNDTQISRIRGEVNNLLARNIELQNNYRYPVFNIDAEEEDNTFADTTPPETTVDKTTLIESDIIDKIEEGDAEAIDEILKVMDSDNSEEVNNYLAKFNPDTRYSMDNNVEDELEPQPIQTNLADVDPDPKLDPDPNPKPEDTVLPTLSADSPVQQFSQNIARDASLPLIDIGQQREKVLQEAEKYDVPAIPETESINSIARYLTEDLSKNLNTVISLRKEIKGIEDRNSQSINRFYRKKKDRLSKLEKDIKSKIGDFINPVSGDISISNQGYKNAIFKRLEKEFGSELYPALASLSNIKK